MTTDIKEIIGDYNLFLDTIFELLNNAGFSNEELKELPIDHICYRVSSNELYEEKKNQLNQLNCKLLVETEIGGRLISTFKLNEPLNYKNQYFIPLIELPAPKKNRINHDGLEHIEMVIDGDKNLITENDKQTSFQNFVDNHPSTNKNFKWVLHALKKEINADVECEFIDPRFTYTNDSSRTISVKFHHQPLEKVVEYEIQLLNEKNKNKN